MAARIDYFFTPISGFAYLGHEALLRLVREHDATLAVRPADMLAVFAAVGVTPPPRQPAPRLAYRRVDMARWAAARRLPLVVEPRFWPTDASLAARAIIAADTHGGEAAAGALAGRLLAAVWVEDRDVAEPATVAAMAEACGLDGAALLDAARGTAAGEAFDRNTAEAIARGVLGSPTYCVGEAMFFGQDRLTFVAEALADAPAA